MATVKHRKLLTLVVGNGYNQEWLLNVPFETITSIIAQPGSVLEPPTAGVRQTQISRLWHAAGVRSIGRNVELHFVVEASGPPLERFGAFVYSGSIIP